MKVKRICKSDLSEEIISVKHFLKSRNNCDKNLVAILRISIREGYYEDYDYLYKFIEDDQIVSVLAKKKRVKIFVDDDNKELENRINAFVEKLEDSNFHISVCQDPRCYLATIEYYI